MHHHRAGNLQQKNKGHKRGQHDSKRKLDRRFHGRVDQSRPGKGAHRESVKSLSRYAFKGHGWAEWVAAVAAPVPTQYVWCNSLAQGGKAKRFNAAKQKLRARKAEILMARRMGTLAAHATTPCMLRRVGLVPGSAANCARVQMAARACRKLWCCCRMRITPTASRFATRCLAKHRPSGRRTWQR